jgi:hypothetical protein
MAKGRNQRWRKARRKDQISVRKAEPPPGGPSAPGERDAFTHIFLKPRPGRGSVAIALLEPKEFELRGEIRYRR